MKELERGRAAELQCPSDCGLCAPRPSQIFLEGNLLLKDETITNEQSVVAYKGGGKGGLVLSKAESKRSACGSESLSSLSRWNYELNLRSIRRSESEEEKERGLGCLCHGTESVGLRARKGRSDKVGK